MLEFNLTDSKSKTCRLPTLGQLKTNPALAFPQEEWEIIRDVGRSEELDPVDRLARIVRIRDRLFQNERQIDVERARYTTQSYRDTEGQPMPIRRAKMLLHLVRQMSITIHPDELIMGNRSLLPRMGVIAPEGAVDWVDKELEILPTRPQDRFNIQPEQIRELRKEIFPYWRGNTLEDTVAARVKVGNDWHVYHEDGTLLIVQREGCLYFEQMHSPLADSDDSDFDDLATPLEKVMWTSLGTPPASIGYNEEGLEKLVAGAKALRESTDKAIIGRSENIVAMLDAVNS